MIVDCAVYTDGHRRDGPLPVERAVEACRAPGSFVWIGLYEPSGREFEEIQREFAILAVPTMRAGVYGMNFEHMPELEWKLGYPLVIAVMLTVCFILFRYFKRVGWL